MRYYVLSCVLLLALDCQVASSSTNQPDPERLAYNLRTSVEAYDKIGHKNPAWDAEATNCLRQFARISSLPWDDASISNLNRSLQILDKAKCDDPLIHY